MNGHWVLFGLLAIIFVIFTLSLCVILYFLWGSLKTSESRATHILNEVTEGKQSEFSLGGISFEDEVLIISFLQRKQILYEINEETTTFSLNGHEFLYNKRILKIEHASSKFGKILNFPK